MLKIYYAYNFWLKSGVNVRDNMYPEYVFQKTTVTARNFLVMILIG